MNLVRFSNQKPSIFNHIFDHNIQDWNNKQFSNTNTTLPKVNILENTDEYKVSFAAPGFNKKDFSIEIDNDILTISSERAEKSEENNDERYTQKEFSYQSFTRSFTLPVLVEKDHINAQYENGILNVSIPKKEEAKPKPSRQIDIK